MGCKSAIVYLVFLPDDDLNIGFIVGDQFVNHLVDGNVGFLVCVLVAILFGVVVVFGGVERGGG